MFRDKNIIYFNPYYFDNGESKPKYFIVLKNLESNLLIASLPTSKDHIPSSLEKKSGCINDDSKKVNCFFFKAGDVISCQKGFCFPLDTFIYGEQVDIVERIKLESIYQKEDIDYEIKGELDDAIYNSIIECLKGSATVKRKIKKRL